LMYHTEIVVMSRDLRLYTLGWIVHDTYVAMPSSKIPSTGIEAHDIWSCKIMRTALVSF